MGVRPDGGSRTSCEKPFHLASARGHAEVVALLLQNGASVSSATHTRGEIKVRFILQRLTVLSILSDYC